MRGPWIISPVLIFLASSSLSQTMTLKPDFGSSTCETWRKFHSNVNYQKEVVLKGFERDKESIYSKHNKKSVPEIIELQEYKSLKKTVNMVRDNFEKTGFIYLYLTKKAFDKKCITEDEFNGAFDIASSVRAKFDWVLDPPERR